MAATWGPADLLWITPCQSSERPAHACPVQQSGGGSALERHAHAAGFPCVDGSIAAAPCRSVPGEPVVTDVVAEGFLLRAEVDAPELPGWAPVTDYKVRGAPERALEHADCVFRAAAMGQRRMQGSLPLGPYARACGALRPSAPALPSALPWAVWVRPSKGSALHARRRFGWTITRASGKRGSLQRRSKLRAARCAGAAALRGALPSHPLPTLSSPACSALSSAGLLMRPLQATIRFSPSKWGMYYDLTRVQVAAVNSYGAGPISAAFIFHPPP